MSSVSAAAIKGVPWRPTRPSITQMGPAVREKTVDEFNILGRGSETKGVTAILIASGQVRVASQDDLKVVRMDAEPLCGFLNDPFIVLSLRVGKALHRPAAVLASHKKRGTAVVDNKINAPLAARYDIEFGVGDLAVRHFPQKLIRLLAHVTVSVFIAHATVLFAESHGFHLTGF